MTLIDNSTDMISTQSQQHTDNNNSYNDIMKVPRSSTVGQQLSVCLRFA